MNMQKTPQSKTPTKITPSFRTLLYIFLGLIALRATYYSLSDGFSLERIENTFPRNEHELTRPSDDEILTLKNICSNPFVYLSKGSQAYAFQSQDGQYVLKLFKCYHLKPIPWLERLPLVSFLDSYRHTQLERRRKKAQDTLNSYKIAHDVIRDECGLLFLQIVPSPYFHQEVTFTDKIGRTCTINLANYGFMIQKKGELIFPKLEYWIRQKKLKDAKKFLRSLINLIVLRSQKGVQDQDPDLHKNAGCIGTHAVFLDVGGFHLNEDAKRPEVYVNDVRKITKKLSLWLKTHSPELADYLEETTVALNIRPDNQEIGIVNR